MIVLKILLFILLAVLGVILLVLIMPVGGEVSFIGGKLKYKVNLWMINVMDSDGGGILGWLKKRKAKKKPKKPQKPKKPKKAKKKKNKKSDKPPEIDSGYTLADTEEPYVQSLDEIPEPDTAENAVSGGQASGEEPISEREQADRQETEDIPGGDADAEFPEYDPEDAEDEESGKKKKKRKKDKDDDEDEKEKKPLSDKIDMLLDIWGSAKNPLSLIFKAFKFSDLYIDFVIANEDAYKCALNYGRLSAVTYRGLALMSRIFTVRLKTVDIQPGFGMKKGRFDAAFKLRFRAGTFVIAGLWFLVTYIFRVFIPGKLKKRKEKKSAPVQK